MEAINPELEARILANRRDPVPYLVYADWLQSQGDPRGELIAVQHALRHQYEASKQPFDRLVDPPSGRRAPPLPNKDALVNAERELAAKHLGEWLGPAVDLSWNVHPRWRMGFIDEARFHVALPIFHEGRNLIADVLARPAARLVRSVKFRHGLDWNPTFQQWLEQASTYASVEELRIAGEGWSVDRKRHGRLRIARLASAFPRLRTLRVISSMPIDLASLDFAQLRMLEIRGEHGGHILELARAHLPNLETLIVHCGLIPDVSELIPALDEHTPRLRRLHLRGAQRADRLLVELARSQILDRLERLDLSDAQITHASLGTILAHAPRFRRLRLFALPKAAFSESEREELNRAARAFSWYALWSRRTRAGETRTRISQT